MENYLTLSIGKYLVFKDSLKFLGTSRQTLAQNLLKGGMDKFQHLKAQIPTIPDDQLQLLFRKGVYPYVYMDSMERFDEQQLPPQEKFFSKLHDSGISDEDYAHAQNVWRTFNIQNMRGYHDLYLMSMSERFYILLKPIFLFFSIISFSIGSFY